MGFLAFLVSLLRMRKRPDAYDFLAAHHDSPDHATGRDLT
jgi:hypothetical protein